MSVKRARFFDMDGREFQGLAQIFYVHLLFLQTQKNFLYAFQYRFSYISPVVQPFTK
jgi:hypothetical protein